MRKLRIKALKKWQFKTTEYEEGDLFTMWVTNSRPADTLHEDELNTWVHKGILEIVAELEVVA